MFSEEINVFDSDLVKPRLMMTKSKHTDQLKKSILNIKLHGKHMSNGTLLPRRRSLIIMTQNKVISLPAHYCSLKTQAKQCDNSIYPYCIWSNKSMQCVEFNQQFNPDLLADIYVKAINATTIANLVLTNISTNLTVIEIKASAASLVDLNHFKSYFRVSNHNINVSIDLVTFVLSMIGFFTVSFLIGTLLAFLIMKYCKIFNKIGKPLKNDLNKDVLEARPVMAAIYSSIEQQAEKLHMEQQFGLVSSACSSGTYSPTIDDSKAGSDPRYVYFKNNNNNNNNKDLSVNTSPVQVLNERFMDYDESEYFTLKKFQVLHKQSSGGSGGGDSQFNLMPCAGSYDSSSTSCSSTSSAQIANSLTLLVKPRTNTKHSHVNPAFNDIYEQPRVNQKKYYL